jgi:hypothetical protein
MEAADKEEHGAPGFLDDDDNVDAEVEAGPNFFDTKKSVTFAAATTSKRFFDRGTTVKQGEHFKRENRAANPGTGHARRCQGHFIVYRYERTISLPN